MAQILGAVSVGFGILSLLVLVLPVFMPGTIPNVGLINLIVSAAAIISGAMARWGGSRIGCLGMILGGIPVLVFAVVLVLMAMAGS